MADGLPGLLGADRPIPRGFRMNSADMINMLYGQRQVPTPSPDEVRENLREIAINGAPIAAMSMAGPIGGLALRGLLAAPKTAMMSTGLAGLLGMSRAIGADEDGLTEAERAELKTLRQKMEKGAFGSAADRRSTEKRASELNAKSADYGKQQNDAALRRREADEKSARDEADASKARQSSLFADKRLEADAVRRDILNKADKPFAEQFPTWNSVQPFMPGIVGAATMLPLAFRGSMGAAGAARTWRAAATEGLAAKEASTLADKANLAESFARQFPKPTVRNTMAGYSVPAAIGTMEGAAVANLPDAYNASLAGENPQRRAYEEAMRILPGDHPDLARMNDIYQALPKGNPARDAALSYFGNPTAVAAKTAVGGIEGMGGATVATTAGKWLAPSEKSLPRAQTEALLKRFDEIKNRIAEAKGYHVSADEANAAVAAARARMLSAAERPVPIEPSVALVPQSPGRAIADGLTPAQRAQLTPAQRARQYFGVGL